MIPRLYLFGLTLALLSQTGCIILWETEPRYVRDPQAQNYRKVVAVNHHNITLEDGRTIEAGGVDLANSSDAMCQSYQSQLDRLVGQYALVAAESNGKAHVLSRAQADPPPIVPLETWPRHFEGLTIVLFTFAQDVPPPRDDIGLNFILGGYGQAKLDELGDAQGRTQYRQAQAQAQQTKVGIWEFTHWSKDVEQALYTAFLHNDLEQASYLLEKSPGRPKPADLHSILCLTAGIPHVPGVEMLLAHGADANAADPDTGNLPLMIAISHSTGDMPIPGNAPMVKTLLQHGANANLGFNGTPVQVTLQAENNKTERVWLPREEMTPLMLAAKGGNIEIVTMLLDAGADPTIRTKPTDSQPNGQTALDIAKRHIVYGPRWQQIADLFQRRGILF